MHLANSISPEHARPIYPEATLTLGSAQRHGRGKRAYLRLFARARPTVQISVASTWQPHALACDGAQAVRRKNHGLHGQHALAIARFLKRM
eukprot:6200535-Pleurochrysis_carterae.AAC.3